MLFSVREPEETLREVSESAIREIVGQSRARRRAGRERARRSPQSTKELIQRTLDSYSTGI